jgi:hypothetical protein
MPSKRTVVIVYILLMALLTICPPWKYVANIPGAGIVNKPAGYGFIFAPPATEHPGNSFFGISIDFVSLILHWLAITILYFAYAAIMFQEKRRTYAEMESDEDDKLLLKYGHRLPKRK